ncbi:MAG: TetR/AcrR family transcriptional regulator [Polyangiaceae bacterium]
MNTLETTADPKTDKSDKAVDWNNPRVASILSAAAKCFARKGFSATTLAEIGKELGLRKSIVHYYFASKAALIHEVQSYSQHKYLARVQDAIKATADTEPQQRLVNALRSLWEVLEANRTAMHLNIEVWSASRRDAELQRRAALLQQDARHLISEGIADVLKVDAAQFPQMRALSTLVLAVLNGLAVAEFLEGEESGAKEAFDTFLYLLRLGQKQMQEAAAAE